MKHVSGKYISIAILAIISSMIYCRNLDWGTPNAQRTCQVFKNNEEIKKYAPKMLELRNNYYTEVMKFVEGNRKVTKEAFKEVFGNPEAGEFEKLPESTVLNCSRGYLLGVVLSDEQHTPNAISRMNIKKFDFNPKHYLYGGFYFYWQAAALLTAKIIGYITLDRNIESYFYNPDETARMYAVMRLIGFFSMALIAVFLFLILKQYTDYPRALLITSVILLTPLFLYYGKLVKPHLFGVMFVMAGIYWCHQILKNGQLQDYTLAGFSFGLATSVMYNNAIMFVSLPLVELLRVDFSLNKIKIKESLYSLFAFLSVFSLANYYIFLNFNNFYNLAIAQNKEIYDYIGFSASKGIPYFISSIKMGSMWVLIPGAITGFIWAVAADKFARYVAYLAVFTGLGTNFYFRHDGIWTICLLFILILFAFGVAWLLNNKKRLLRIAGYFYTCAIIGFFLLQLISYNSLFTRNGNLTYAGKWINENLPKKSSIGVPNGWFLPATFPAFSFLEYTLINIPVNADFAHKNKSDLPEYMIVTSVMDENLKKQAGQYYSSVKSWQSKGKVLGFNFYSPAFPTENMDIEIYKLN